VASARDLRRPACPSHTVITLRAAAEDTTQSGKRRSCWRAHVPNHAPSGRLGSRQPTALSALASAPARFAAGPAATHCSCQARWASPVPATSWPALALPRSRRPGAARHGVCRRRRWRGELPNSPQHSAHHLPTYGRYRSVGSPIHPPSSPQVAPRRFPLQHRTCPCTRAATTGRQLVRARCCSRRRRSCETGKFPRRGSA